MLHLITCLSCCWRRVDCQLHQTIKLTMSQVKILKSENVKNPDKFGAEVYFFVGKTEKK